jgi:uncharacterized coiled-coil protein SlyX
MTPQLNHKPQDTSYGERIVRLETINETQEAQLDRVVDKIDKLVDVVHDLKTGQEVILAQFKDFEEKCEERIHYAFEVVADYKATLVRLDDKFRRIDNEFKRQTQEIEKGAWLIDWACEAAKPRKVISAFCKFVLLPGILLAAAVTKLHAIDFLPLMKLFGIIR